MQQHKDLLFLRHGQSTKNEAASNVEKETGNKFDWNSPEMAKNIVYNPLYLDAHLSATGRQQCE